MLPIAAAAFVLSITHAGGVEYPLAGDFVAAHPSNYVAEGMQTPQYVIIHQMDGTYGSTLYWFQDPASNVSTQYIMRASDGWITQMVRHADMAQHIGGYNPSSFGIEHEGFIYEAGWFTWEMYVASAQLTRWLCDSFAIPVDREHILGHVEVPGASHTDPGPYWEWDMYMALVHDVVPQARVEGVLVDQSAPCTITATSDTWITTTLEGLDALDDDEQCFLPAGTELDYLHASPEMIEQSRLTMEGGGPCAGMGTLEYEAYVYLPSFTALCEPEPLASHAALTVAVGDAMTTVAADGSFVLDGIAAGEHSLEVESDGAWMPTLVPIDVAVYPGVRVIVPVQPGMGGTDTGGSSDDAGETTDAAAEDDGSSGAGSAVSSEQGSSGDGTPVGSSDEGSLPGGDGPAATGDAGCGCRAAPAPSGLAWLLPPLMYRARARRRASAPTRRARTASLRRAAPTSSRSQL